MGTIRNLITGSLRSLNVVSTNEDPSADDVQVCLDSLNSLLASLDNDLLNIYTFTPHRYLFVPGQQDYTLGPALNDGLPTNADWVTERPMRIEQAKVLLWPIVSPGVIDIGPGTVTTPLTSLSMYEWTQIGLRTMPNNWPTVFYDNGNYPLRTISVWPIPTQQQAIELWLWEPLNSYSSLDEELNLPPGYERYLRLKLAIEVSAIFGKEPSQTLLATAVIAEDAVKRLNQQLPKGVVSNTGQALTRHGNSWAYKNVQGGVTPRQW